MLLEDTLITLFGIISEEGAFKLKNLRIDPKSLLLLYQLLLIAKEKLTLKSLARYSLWGHRETNTFTFHTLSRKLQVMYVHKYYKEKAENENQNILAINFFSPKPTMKQLPVTEHHDPY